MCWALPDASSRVEPICCLLQVQILRLTETHVRRVVTRETMSAKQTQHDAADALFRAIIETLDKHRSDRTLTEKVLEDLASAYSAISTDVPEQGRLG
jgi:hypothetical protein